MRRLYHLLLLLAVAAAAAVTCANASPAARLTVEASTVRGGTASLQGSVWKPALPIGRTVRLARRTRRENCTLGAEPDHRCSPGAYYSKLTKAVLCSPSFRPSMIAHVPTSLKHAVRAEYRFTAPSKGAKVQIDHIVPLELGGSNDIANLFPQRAPGYQLKDALEHVLHARVCQGLIGLRSAQRQIAANWELLYTKLNGVGH